MLPPGSGVLDGEAPSWRGMTDRVRRGLAPAEVLPQTVRHRLFRELRDEGMTVPKIAALTMTTEYTVARILGYQDRDAI